ncbi:hypothetical protein GBAR_LOCUS18318 [Geodia barretti]|uniref:Secreted protein n=1 Tax=Geodia barretti TaxID=519541 RepID=A0AA35SNM1_GEOBA|nr:hypothetical protein GBAR_LOCUS18318 [Geodia barretti]
MAVMWTQRLLADLCMVTVFTGALDTSFTNCWPTLLSSSLLLTESALASSLCGLPSRLPPSSTGTGSNSSSYTLRSIFWQVAE